jgi:hypothetical protein
MLLDEHWHDHWPTMCVLSVRLYLPSPVASCSIFSSREIDDKKGFDGKDGAYHLLTPKSVALSSLARFGLSSVIIAGSHI